MQMVLSAGWEEFSSSQQKAAVRALHVPCTRRDPRSLNVPIVVYHNGLRYPVIEPFFPSFELVALHKAKMQVGQRKFVIYYRRDNIMEVNQTTSASFRGIQWRGDFLILQIDDGERPMNISGWSDRRAAVWALIKFVTPYNSDYCSKDGACVSLLQSALPISEHHLLQETDNLMVRGMFTHALSSHISNSCVEYDHLRYLWHCLWPIRERSGLLLGRFHYEGSSPRRVSHVLVFVKPYHQIKLYIILANQIATFTSPYSVDKMSKIQVLVESSPPLQ